MKRRIVILISVVVVLCSVIAIMAYFFVPSKEWPGKESCETQNILYEGREYRYRDEIINILFVGVDEYAAMDEINNEADNGFADAVFLVSIDTEKRDCKITIIPRDTVTTVFWMDKEGNIAGSEKIQLTYQYTLGNSPEQCGRLMKEAVSTLLYQIPIHQYCTLNYSSVSIVNDMVGGVDVEVIEDLQWVNEMFVLGETIHLEGDAARQYVGERNTNEDGTSLTRLERQRQYIKALFAQAKIAIKENPALVFELCWKLRENMSTDISLREIVYLVGLLPDMNLDDTTIQRFEGEQIKGKLYEEFYPNEVMLKQMVIDTFYDTKKK